MAPLLTKLLMIHSAKQLWEAEGLKEEDKNFYKKLFVLRRIKSYIFMHRNNESLK